MHKLKAFIRATVLEKARDYAHPAKRRTHESTLSAFRDAAHGVDSGWWNDLIYTVDRLRLFNRYRLDVLAAIQDYLAETGQSASDVVNPRGHSDTDKITFVDMVAACARRWTWEDYISDDYSPRNNGATAATLALAFAVEYLLSSVAADCGCEL